jgi:sulfite reductase (NADPH) hemoprotein beta-component
MYRYDEFDATLVRERVEQFRGQAARRLAGELTEDQFRPLRLKNGLYLQLHAYMLRVAIPYGELSSRQMRKLAYIARRYDRGFGHFTTRQNIQYNWPELVDTPDILAHLAEVEMHAIQTSGNCIRNVTADQFAGVAADEIEDPRQYAELIRQWSTLHPEFSYLPRKFKIAVTGSPNDRAAVRFHDIGLRMVKDKSGDTGFEVIVGGGQGRTPVIGIVVREFLPKGDLLSYLEAILRVYNLLGRRDNLYKARIKILVQQAGPAEFRRLVEEEWEKIRDGALGVEEAEIERIRRYFALPELEKLPDYCPEFELAKRQDPEFARWARGNLFAHRVPGYSIVTISLKPEAGVPGDASADQMDLMADLADRFSHGELRVTHHQNIVLPHVRKQDLPALHRALAPARLGTANVGLVSDIRLGLDYQSGQRGRSRSPQLTRRRRSGAPREIARRGSISRCINACGHHHVGHIVIRAWTSTARNSTR